MTGGDTVVVGVVIRTLNESELLGSCLDALRGQSGPFGLDVLVVDSGSTDDTIEIARSHGARVLEISPAAFDYSTALNTGLAQVSGDLAVVLSAHAVPVGSEWLRAMTRPFVDPRVAGVYCRQVPWPDAPWQEVHRLRHQFGDTSHVFADPADVTFSNAASAIRLDVWRDEPFALPAAEDVEWAKRVVAKGWRVVYAADAVVRHSHHESARAQALRMIDLHRALDVGRPPRSSWRTIREAGGFVVRDGRKIAALEGQPPTRKLAYLTELVRMAWYYVVDFPRAGSTAERRRAYE